MGITSSRTAITRYREHLTHINYGSSSMFQILNSLTISFIQLDLRNNRKLLGDCETLDIIKSNTITNIDRGLIRFSCL